VISALRCRNDGGKRCLSRCSAGKLWRIGNTGRAWCAGWRVAQACAVTNMNSSGLGRATCTAACVSGVDVTILVARTVATMTACAALLPRRGFVAQTAFQRRVGHDAPRTATPAALYVRFTYIKRQQNFGGRRARALGTGVATWHRGPSADVWYLSCACCFVEYAHHPRSATPRLPCCPFTRTLAFTFSRRMFDGFAA